jgi:hypothetical protein
MTLKRTVTTLLPLLGLTSSIVLMGVVNPHSVQAAGLIGNLPQSNDDDGTYDLRQEKRKGISFTLPSGPNYSLTDAIYTIRKLR